MPFYTDSIGGGIGTEFPNYVRGGNPRSPADDGAFGPFPLGFSLTYFGQTYDRFFVNINGNISLSNGSFGNGVTTFTPESLNTTSIAPIIAPYWADIDTRPMNGGKVTLRTDIPNQVIITWDQVGYFSNNTDKLASFQLVLRGPNYNTPPNEGNIGFFYKDIQWETGNASGGTGGFGGTQAAAGFGDGLSAINPGEVAIAGSQQAGISQRLSNNSFWFKLGAGGIPIGDSNTVESSPSLTPISLNFDGIGDLQPVANFLPPTASVSISPIGDSNTVESSPSRTPISLNFDGIGDLQPVANFLPPTAGVSISPNALGIVDFASGGSGNFLSTTGGRNTAVTYKEGDSIVLNVNDGFTGQLSFKYSSPFFDGHQVKIYDGLNATGSQLNSVPLARTNEGRGLIGAYNPFEPFTIPFNGTAKSIQIGSRADKLLIDDIELAASTPASTLFADISVSQNDSPEPVTVGNNLTYRVTVTNNSPVNAADNVVLTDNLPAGVTFVTDNLPAGVTFVSANSSQGTVTVNPAGTGNLPLVIPVSPSAITANLGTIPPNGSVVTTIVVTPTAAGLINNTVSVSTSSSDPNLANNSASETTAVSSTPTPPTLALSRISGSTFNDLNRNGIQDPNEVVLSNVRIFIDANNNGLLDAAEFSAVTNTNGNFQFTNVSPGNYTVREVVPSGSTPTTANPVNVNLTNGSNATVVFGIAQQPTLTSLGLAGEWQYTSPEDFNYQPGRGFLGGPPVYAAPLNITQNGNQITVSGFYLNSRGPGQGQISGNTITANLPLTADLGSGQLTGTISPDGRTIQGNITFSDGQQGTQTATIPFTFTSQASPGGNDTITGDNGDNFLAAGLGNDTLIGLAGTDQLTGGAGLDQLTGGAGNDLFTFNNPNEGTDTITDFEPGSDRIFVSSLGFGNFTRGPISPNQFALGTTALDINVRFIYDRPNGSLFYDPDGGGPASQVQLATLLDSPALSATDILQFF